MNEGNSRTSIKKAQNGSELLSSGEVKSDIVQFVIALVCI